jgi:hypothetical protein
MPGHFADPDMVQIELEAVAYFADEGLGTAIFLAEALRKPLLLEREPLSPGHFGGGRRDTGISMRDCR